MRGRPGPAEPNRSLGYDVDWRPVWPRGVRERASRESCGQWNPFSTRALTSESSTVAGGRTSFGIQTEATGLGQFRGGARGCTSPGHRGPHRGPYSVARHLVPQRTTRSRSVRASSPIRHDVREDQREREEHKAEEEIEKEAVSLPARDPGRPERNQDPDDEEQDRAEPPTGHCNEHSGLLVGKSTMQQFRRPRVRARACGPLAIVGRRVRRSGRRRHASSRPAAPRPRRATRSACTRASRVGDAARAVRSGRRVRSVRQQRSTVVRQFEQPVAVVLLVRPDEVARRRWRGAAYLRATLLPRGTCGGSGRPSVEKRRVGRGPPYEAWTHRAPGLPASAETESPDDGVGYDATAWSCLLKTASARIKSPIPVRMSAIPTTMPNSEICEAM